jgi:anaerobic dimethyl sulfoxide reductase subunit B (iron-sulfur subunit)
MESCPTDSIRKDKENGAVLIDKTGCIGCGSCADACPYDAPSINEKEGKMYKCDMCIDLVRDGKNPVCVDGCLQRVIKTGDISTLRRQYGTLNTVEPLPSGDQTNPSVVFKAPMKPKRLVNPRVRNYTEL